jgi:hypothetical protein
VLIQEEQVVTARDVQKGAARPGGYVVTGAHLPPGQAAHRGFVLEGAAPFGRTDDAMTGALHRAAMSGMPVVRVGRGCC